MLRNIVRVSCAFRLRRSRKTLLGLYEVHITELTPESYDGKMRCEGYKENSKEEESDPTGGNLEFTRVPASLARGF
ncbi:Hypothetical protein NTJ_13605 [Nesidiocoris tenuis]|uniref:Uncharacterized protein n=1 Tax=Nesidiocoris tenuis TaxID=355587 RepID=A0ABN7B963_9HEMI|nr:Hypothetical protein NTJ_13605 [Nesidiocoris tenuis]